MLRRENVFWADDDPVYRVTTYVPWTIAEGTGLLEAEVPHPYGIHGVLEDQGYPMARLHDVATARMPTRAEKAALHLPAGVPVIDLLHVSVRADGQPYERGDIACPRCGTHLWVVAEPDEVGYLDDDRELAQAQPVSSSYDFQ